MKGREIKLGELVLIKDEEFTSYKKEQTIKLEEHIYKLLTIKTMYM